MIGNGGIVGVTHGTGYEAINKYGENPDIDIASVPEAIWAHGGVFPFLGVGIAMDIKRVFKPAEERRYDGLLHDLTVCPSAQ